jgi:hypothetical protein
MLNATAIRARTSAKADLNLSELSCIRHVVIEPDEAQRLLVHTTDKSVAIVLRGEAIISTPVNVRFHVDGMAESATAGAVLMRLAKMLTVAPRYAVQSVRRNLLRNAMMALDGRRAGASYRDIANVAFGHDRASSAWNSPSRAMKDQMVRALAKGEMLANGEHLLLLL